VGRIQECKIPSAAKYIDTGSLSKYNRVTNPRIELSNVADFSIIPVLLFNVGYCFTELILLFFFIIVTLRVAISLQESSAGVADMFNLEMLAAASS
jgi:hypothetical protein